jgi:DNA-binding response OmpR family regulator
MHDIPVTARQVGADAYVTKPDGAHELLAATERVMELDDESGLALDPYTR